MASLKGSRFGSNVGVLASLARDAGCVHMPRLSSEHPTLATVVGEIVDALQMWRAEIQPVANAGAWMHHGEFAERTVALADHLGAALALAEEELFPSALALMRTALEHHLLDRLILLADRYEEVVSPPDPSQVDELEREWKARSAPWTSSVASIERIRAGRALKLVRNGHDVRDSSGNVAERISPYWVALEHYDPFVGHPDRQAETARPFRSVEELETWARKNQAVYSAFLKWDSICWNLQLSELVTPATVLQLRVHYSFLSAFTHATNAGRRANVKTRTRPGGPSATHVLGELVLLYAATIAASEIETWAVYTEQRPRLLVPLATYTVGIAGRVRETVSYFWFLGGMPQPFDTYQEANRRAAPLVRGGQRVDFRPEEIPIEEVAYYGDPLERLSRMHTGESEIMTGFGFPPGWPELHW